MIPPGIYSPSKTMGNYITDYQTQMRAIMTAQIRDLNSTNFAVNRTHGRFNSALNSQLSGLNRNISSLFNFKSNGEHAATRAAGLTCCASFAQRWAVCPHCPAIMPWHHRPLKSSQVLCPLMCPQATSTALTCWRCSAT